MVDAHVRRGAPLGGECSWTDPWLPPHETDLELRASYRPAGGTWQSQRIPGTWGGCDSRGYPDSGGLSLAVDRAGTATAAWQGDGKLLVSQHRPGGRWTAPLNVGGVQAEPQVVATPHIPADHISVWAQYTLTLPAGADRSAIVAACR